MKKQITKEAVELAIKHSPEILLGCGIVGVMTHQKSRKILLIKTGRTCMIFVQVLFVFNKIERKRGYEFIK